MDFMMPDGPDISAGLKVGQLFSSWLPVWPQIRRQNRAEKNRQKAQFAG
jgi:hypothetical protein